MLINMVLRDSQTLKEENNWNGPKLEDIFGNF